MPTVKVLIDGVGNWTKGDIVKDAPLGLVQIAEQATKNAASGELIAELIEDEVKKGKKAAKGDVAESGDTVGE